MSFGGSTVSQLDDFNNRDHRIASASALFQKGIYHFLVVKTYGQIDRFAEVLRVYQCIFDLRGAMVLLDEGFRLQPYQPDVKRFCPDSKPTRAKIDPAVLLKHDTVENKWPGYPKDHRFGRASREAGRLLKAVVELRHIVIYRPMLLDGGGWCWEDCPLYNYLDHLPGSADVESVYREFSSALMEELRHQMEQRAQWKHASDAGALSDAQPAPQIWAYRF